MLKYIPGIIIMLALAAMLFYAVIDGLSAENWYADKHDAKCEKLGYKAADCKCYNRFIHKAKKAGEK